MHNEIMSKSITIRNVPDETRELLASRAAASGRSLQEYLRSQLIELAETMDVETWVAEVRELKSLTQSRATIEQILGHRDAGRP
jgi:plasmid stability protein